jgi:chaperone required for assembly of F1-ATPase
LGLLEQLTGSTKSLSISLAYLNRVINSKEAYLLSHSEEHYQKAINGEVEGHHDIYNEMIMAKLYSTISFHKMLYL